MTATERGARGVSAWAWPSLALLAGMVFVPTAFSAPKAALFALALLIALAARALFSARTLHPSTAAWGLALAAVGLAFMVRGMLRGEPGALRVGTVYVAWPLAFVALAASAADDRVLWRHLRVLVIAALAASVYGLAFALEQGGWLGRSPFPELFPDQGIGLYEGYVELRLPMLATLPFAVPFLIAAAATWRPGRPAPAGAVWVWLALVASLFLAVLSGRRAVQLVVALAVPLTLLAIHLLPRAERRDLRASAAALVIGICVVLGSVQAFASDVFGFDVGVLWEEFQQGFDPRATESSSIRAIQLEGLIDAWSRAPLLGAGHGGFLRDHIRDADRPWAYELSYPTLLFQTGLIGFLIYGALIAWLLAQMARVVRAGGAAGRAMLPCLVGLLSFLLANATNPYLLKFDFMWTLFLPLALVNRWRVAREEAWA